MKRVLLLALVLVGCAGETESAQTTTVVQNETTVAGDTAAFPQFVDPADLTPMPAYPGSSAGKFAVASSGSVDLSGLEDAVASVCNNPSMLMLQAGTSESWAYLVLLQVPANSERAAVYPVKHVDSGFPEPPASAMGVQRIGPDGTGTALQGLQGFVEVFSFGETLSGRLQITVRDILTEDLVQLAATFQDIQVHQRSPEECLPAAAING